MRPITLGELHAMGGHLVVGGDAPPGHLPFVWTDEQGDLHLEVIPEEVALRRLAVMEEAPTVDDDGFVETLAAVAAVTNRFDEGPVVWDNDDGTLSYGPATYLAEQRVEKQSTTERPWGEYLVFEPRPDGSVAFYRVINERP